MPHLLRRALAAGLSVAVASCGTFLAASSDDDPPRRVDASEASEASPADDAGTDAACSPDLSRDPASCGACGRSCFGGACEGGKCQPQLVANVGGAVTRLVRHGESLYVIARLPGASEVLRIRNAPPTAIERLDPSPQVGDVPGGETNVAVHPSGIYWGTPNGLRRRAVDGDAGADAGIETLSAHGAPVMGVRIAGNTLHFTVFTFDSVPAPNQGRVKTCTLPACADVTGPFADMPLDVAIVGGVKVWLAFPQVNGNGFVLHDAAGPIGGQQDQPRRFASDDKRVVWSTVEGVRSLVPPSRTIEDLVPPTTLTTRVEGVAMDETGALWLAHQKTLERCTITAGRCVLETIATSTAEIVDVAVDDRLVYWGESDGSVKRIRRP
jgi:hypothetical protein